VRRGPLVPTWNIKLVKNLKWTQVFNSCHIYGLLFYGRCLLDSNSGKVLRSSCDSLSNTKTLLSTCSFNGIGNRQRDMQIVMCIKACSNAAILREKNCIRQVVVSTKASTKTTKCEGGKRSSDFC
jgi:hypothetical protein